MTAQAGPRPRRAVPASPEVAAVRHDSPGRDASPPMRPSDRAMPHLRLAMRSIGTSARSRTTSFGMGSLVADADPRAIQALEQHDADAA